MNFDSEIKRFCWFMHKRKFLTILCDYAGFSLSFSHDPNPFGIHLREWTLI